MRLLLFQSNPSAQLKDVMEELLRSDEARGPWATGGGYFGFVCEMHSTCTRTQVRYFSRNLGALVGTYYIGYM